MGEETVNARFYSCEVYYDPEDTHNGSLYLFGEKGADDQVQVYIKRLMETALWTRGAIARVRDDQRDAYAKQLEELELVALAPGVWVGRFSHPEFPSLEGRWRAWLKCLKEPH